MLRFFRKMRKALIPENRFGRYFLYALGEIVLVVIGILIALQVNNWNLGRLEKIEEKEILLDLFEEFNQNNIELDRRIKEVEDLNENTAILYYNFERIPDLFTESEVDSMLQIVNLNPKWNISDFILNELKNSGKKSILDNIDLKNLLYNFLQAYDDLIKTEEAHDKAYGRYLTFINENGSMKNIDRYDFRINNMPSKMKISNTKLFEDFRFENYLNDRYVYLEIREIQYKQLKEIIDDILDLTQQDLNGSD